MTGSLPYSRQEVTDLDVVAVAEALRAPLITQGPMVDRFEADLAVFVGADYAVVFNSATAALHAAYAVLGIGPGKSVLTSPITFVATANAALYLGGSVRFADVDPATALIDPDAADDRADRSVKVVTPVHFGGEVAPVEVLAAIAEARGWAVVEDASHALGASYRSRTGVLHRVGACDHSTMCCFSFHAVKQITTGEGGAVTTNDAELSRRLRMFRSHGITRDWDRMSQVDGPWYYEQQDLGYNYRLTDFQCALGRSQLARLPEWVAKRALLAGLYEARLAGVGGVVPLRRPKGSQGAHHLFVVRVPPAERLRIFDTLTAQGIGVNVHYIPVYQQPYHRLHGSAGVHRPGSEEYYRSALTLPLFHGMTDADVDRVVTALERAIVGAAA